MMMIGVDLEKVDGILDEYPLLETILQGGIVSKKMCRTLLGLDRATMDEIYSELLVAQAVAGTSSSCFKAKPDTVKLIKQRIQNRAKSSSTI